MYDIEIWFNLVLKLLIAVLVNEDQFNEFKSILLIVERRQKMIFLEWEETVEKTNIQNIFSLSDRLSLD